jgi:hypothetical protein
LYTSKGSAGGDKEKRFGKCHHETDSKKSNEKIINQNEEKGTNT